MRGMSVGGLVALGLGFLSGCGGEHASAIETSESKGEFVSELPEEPADPNDPFGACVDTEDDGVDYLRCSLPGVQGGCSGRGQLAGELDNRFYEIGRFWVTCQHHCETTAECPVPSTGDAAVECLYEQCRLPCDEDTTCPDGFVCTKLGEGPLGPLCMQYVEFSPYNDAIENLQ